MRAASQRRNDSLSLYGCTTFTVCTGQLLVSRVTGQIKCYFNFPVTTFTGVISEPRGASGQQGPYSRQVRRGLCGFRR
jgi:hypothetical protein